MALPTRLANPALTNPVKNPQNPQNLNANAFAAVLANGIAAGINANNVSVFDLGALSNVSDSNPLNPYIYTLPSLSWKASSIAGTSAADAQMYIFNEDRYIVNPTNNGHGAESISDSYGDGFGSAWYNSLFQTTPGFMIYGFTVAMSTISTGVQNPEGLALLNLSWLNYNGYGGKSVPTEIPLGVAVRNTQFQDGILTVKFPMYITNQGQFNLTLPPDNTIAFTFINTPFN